MCRSIWSVTRARRKANDSVRAVRKLVEDTPPPPGIKAYVTGAAALTADQSAAGDKGVILVTLLTFVVIIVMLLWVYRSFVTMFITLLMVVLELFAARQVVAFLADNNIIGLSTFAVNLLVLMVIAAGTDYAIFVLGRYQEARSLGEDREQAFYTMFHGTAHVVLGSGLTIAGAMYCLSFTRLPYFQSLGVPCAVGTLVAVLAALTLGPAVLTVGSRFGLFDPKRKMRTRGWRRVGTAIVRWPGPILAVSIGIALIGLVALPGYKTNYDNRQYLPGSTKAVVGYEAAERHFSNARMNPELLLIETDHDLRNPADMLVLDRIARGVFHIPGVARVQTITRPLGAPIEHTSIPFQISMQSTTQVENQEYMKKRMADMLKQADAMQQSIDTMQNMYAITAKMAAVTHHMDGLTHEMADVTNELRDQISNFDDFFRPIRSYFYWDKHCFDIPVCWTLRSLFDAIDGIDLLSEKIGFADGDIDHLDALLPQMLAQMPPMIATMQTMKQMMLTMHSSMNSMYDQMDVMSQNSTAMGQAYDAAKNDDSFYIPPEVFDNPDFKRGLKMFVSPDGHAARFIISHDGPPATPEGISHVDPIKTAAKEAIKGTPLEGAKIWLGGTAAVYKDMRDGSKYDLMIAGISAASLILIIMLIITRSLVAAITIVGTVLISLGASFGLSVLLWQDILGIATALDGARDVRNPAVGSGIRLQPIAGFPLQRGNPCRHQDRDHPVDGRHRRRRDVCRSGVRRHHGDVCDQPAASHGSGGHHHRSGPAVRHIDRAFLHDAVGRGIDGALVLVADEGPDSSRQRIAAALRTAARGPRTAAAPGERRHVPQRRNERCGRHRSVPGGALLTVRTSSTAAVGTRLRVGPPM